MEANIASNVNTVVNPVKVISSTAIGQGQNPAPSVLSAIADAIKESNKSIEVMFTAVRHHSYNIFAVKNDIQSINTRLASDQEQYDALEERCKMLEERCKALEERKAEEDRTQLKMESVGNSLVLTVPNSLSVTSPQLPYARDAKEAIARVLSSNRYGAYKPVNRTAVYYWFTDMCTLLAACKRTGDTMARSWIYKRFYSYSEKNSKLKNKSYYAPRARVWCEEGDDEMLSDLVRATIETVYCELRGEKV